MDPTQENLFKEILILGHPSQQMGFSQQYSHQCKYRAAWRWDPLGTRSAEGTHCLGTYAYNRC